MKYFFTFPLLAVLLFTSCNKEERIEQEKIEQNQQLLMGVWESGEILNIRETDMFSFTTAKEICNIAKIDLDLRVKDLSDNQVASVREAITNMDLRVEGERRTEVSMNIKRKRDIGCYQGLRHRRGLPVNGQRTKTNSRTRKGKRRTIGLGKKVVV